MHQNIQEVELEHFLCTGEACVLQSVYFIEATYEDQMRQEQCFWLDPLLVLGSSQRPWLESEPVIFPGRGQGNPPRMFLWGFSQNVSGLGQRRPVDTTDTVSSKWLQPEKTNSFRQPQAKPFSSSLLTNTSFIPSPPSGSADRQFLISDAALVYY